MKLLLDSNAIDHNAQEEQFMLKTNAEKLIKISVMGEIASPTIRSVYNISATENP